MLTFIISFCLIIINVCANPIVNTKYGPVEGISVPIHTGQVIDTFMAVPYGRPPIGDLRFMVSILNNLEY